VCMSKIEQEGGHTNEQFEEDRRDKDAVKGFGKIDAPGGLRSGD
jgi:hypothetical protein